MDEKKKIELLEALEKSNRQMLDIAKKREDERTSGQRLIMWVALGLFGYIAFLILQRAFNDAWLHIMSLFG